MGWNIKESRFCAFSFETKGSINWMLVCERTRHAGNACLSWMSDVDDIFLELLHTVFWMLQTIVRKETKMIPSNTVSHMTAQLNKADLDVTTYWRHNRVGGISESWHLLKSTDSNDIETVADHVICSTGNAKEHSSLFLEENSPTFSSRLTNSQCQLILWHF